MKRTTIMLPATLRESAAKCARQRGLSLGALIRSVLEAEVEGRATSFLSQNVVYRGPLLKGAPRHHDDIYDQDVLAR